MNFRKIQKIRKNVKAISPVISVLLMIAVAVVASLVAYAWVMGYIGGQTSKTGQAIQIQSVAFDDAGHVTTIYVQNVGQGPVTILPDQAVYIEGIQVTPSSTDPAVVAPATSVPLDAGATITINLGTGSDATVYDAASTITIKVTVEGGTYSQLSQVVPAY